MEEKAACEAKLGGKVPSTRKRTGGPNAEGSARENMNGIYDLNKWKWHGCAFLVAWPRSYWTLGRYVFSYKEETVRDCAGASPV